MKQLLQCFSARLSGRLESEQAVFREGIDRLVYLLTSTAIFSWFRSRAFLSSWLFVVLLMSMQSVQAILTIEVTQGNDKAVRVAVSPFSWNGKKILPEDMASVVEENLRLSGLFAPLPRKDMLSFPSSAKDVVYRDWDILGASYLVTGQVKQEGNRFEVNYQLFDIVRQKSILKGKVRGDESQLRGLAHHISDAVYEKITGIPGDFSTRIMYVTADRKSAEHTDYRLNYADADGQRQREILRSREPILSPSWSPDGSRVAYVSFESGRPAIFVQELATGERQKITDFKGLNSSPVFSPDGRQLALVLSKGENPDVYVMDLATNELSQITSHFSIDTEPDWMPDGKSLIFTSNRGGSAQIYQVGVNRLSNGTVVAEGKPKRLTFTGKFNARAKVFPDGKSLALVHKGQGATEFNIAILDLDTGRLRQLTSARLEDSPSVSPGGRRLIYAVSGGKNGELGIVTADGRVKYRLPSAKGDVREPVWGPSIATQR
ncbi:MULTISPECIES: Tol-Pal system beta propeller repeat protein TolB [unclassified Endozoicomonas]|uniref:Tol-Pal system beta propeller repeat protein TolB n=1 Tax=unclassified Endozoicomonas TaxID=2644528 RepID=UPI00214744E6|nr:MULTISPECIES: Tol-Pal system beta propeller repeat protein TolB [unclassified Endozoicomonas]